MGMRIIYYPVVKDKIKPILRIGFENWFHTHLTTNWIKNKEKSLRHR